MAKIEINLVHLSHTHTCPHLGTSKHAHAHLLLVQQKKAVACRGDGGAPAPPPHPRHEAHLTPTPVGEGSNNRGGSLGHRIHMQELLLGWVARSREDDTRGSNALVVQAVLSKSFPSSRSIVTINCPGPSKEARLSLWHARSHGLQ